MSPQLLLYKAVECADGATDNTLSPCLTGMSSQPLSEFLQPVVISFGVICLGYGMLAS